MAPRRRSFVYSLLVLVVLALSATAHAQDYDRAGKHFAAGQERFAGKHFHTAALHFQAAYDITKDPSLLFNVGESWQKAGDAPRAAAAYRAYLKEKPAAQDRDDIERRIAALDDKAAPALVDGSAEGDAAEAAPLLVGGTAPPLPTNEPAPVAVAAPVQATPPPVAVVPPARPAPQVGLLEERPASRLRIAAWSGVAATIALLTTGAILGLAAQSRGDELSRRLSFTDSSGQPVQFDAGAQKDFDDLRHQGRLYNGLAIGFYSASAVMAVVTTTLFLVDWRHKKRRDVAIAPSFSPGGMGLVAGASF